MSRSAADATRFTSTIPHASAISKNGYPKLPRRTLGPVGETPQQKVQRLRAAANRAKEAQINPFDRLVARGRVWANVAHTITTTFLVGATVVAGVVTVYAMTDMVLYNRRKKAEFFKEQKARLDLAIFEARKAIAEGSATPEQINFIKLEDEHQALLAEKKKRSITSKAKGWLYSGLSSDEEDVEREGTVMRQVEDKKVDIASKAKDAFADEKAKQNADSPLDVLGKDAPEQERPQISGWKSWLSRR